MTQPSGRSELHVVEYMEPGGSEWKLLQANGQPLLFSLEGEVEDHVLQRIINSQRVTPPGPCQFRWTTRTLTK